MAKKKMGRPVFELDDKNFDVAIQLPMIKADICLLMGGCSEDTIEKYVKKRFGKTFSELQSERRQHFRKNILGKQYELAMKGNVGLLIWLGKNYLGQRDKFEETDAEDLKLEREVMEKMKLVPTEVLIRIARKSEAQD